MKSRDSSAQTAARLLPSEPLGQGLREARMRSNAILFATVCALLPWSARGQVTTSSIYGSVTDSTGGVVAGATVTLTNAGTGANAAKVTDSDGSFVFDFVRVGTYRLKISAPGFEALETNDIDLQAGTSLRRTFT